MAAGALRKVNGFVREALVTRLKELHPYKESAILDWRCDRATPESIQWLGGLVG